MSNIFCIYISTKEELEGKTTLYQKQRSKIVRNRALKRKILFQAYNIRDCTLYDLYNSSLSAVKN